MGGLWWLLPAPVLIPVPVLLCRRAVVPLPGGFHARTGLLLLVRVLRGCVGVCVA